MSEWIKFHADLTRGAKRGLRRSDRFVYLELALHARPLAGVIELPLGMSDDAGVVDLLGGDVKEIRSALPKLVASEMVVFEGPGGARRCVIVAWGRWNDAPGSSTERVRRHRERVATEVKRVTRNEDGVSETDNGTDRKRSRGEESKEEKSREEISETSPPPLPPEEPRGPERRTASRSSPVDETARSVLRRLAESKLLRDLATSDFANQLAEFSNAGPRTGRFTLEEVLQAIAEAEDKLRVDASVGSGPSVRDRARMVHGFVRQGPKSTVNGAPEPAFANVAANQPPPQKGAVGGI